MDSLEGKPLVEFIADYLLKFKDLDNIKTLKNEDVVNFYNKYIKNTKPKILINGNIDEISNENIEDVITKQNENITSIESQIDKIDDKLEKNNVHSCIECGCCTFTCPAHRPLLDYLRIGKAKVGALIRSRKQ